MRSSETPSSHRRRNPYIVPFVQAVDTCIALKCKTFGGNSYAGTGCRHYTMPCLTLNSKCQGPSIATHIHYVYCAYAYECLVPSRARLYLACFTPVASLWSNIRSTSCPSRSCCVSLVPKLCENGALTHLHIFHAITFVRRFFENPRVKIQEKPSVYRCLRI